MADFSTDDVASLNMERSSWTIVAKVVRLWTTQKFEGARLPFSMEMILMDSKGVKIHATVRKALIYKWHHILAKGRIFKISHFDVVENGGPFQTTKHKFKINMKLDTDIQEVVDTPIPLSPYTFVKFTDVLYKNLDSDVLVDVIGVLTGVGTVVDFEKDNKMQKRNVIEIDSDRIRLECVFFGPYVDELSSYLSSDDMTNAVVVIQCARVKTFQGKEGLQNVYGATKIIFNPDIPEAVLMKQKFLENNDPSTQVLSQLQDPSTVSVEDDFLSITAKKTIEEIKEMKENGTCIVLGTMKHLAAPGDWWYPACKCNKKVDPDENMFYCENCNRHVFSMTPKYRLAVRVADHKEIATFVIFDQEAANLLNKPCSELIDNPFKVVVASPLPKEISSLLGKTYLFKVDVRNSTSSRFEPSYKVKKICSDIEIINQFKTLFPASPGLSITTPSTNTPTSVKNIESSCSNLAKDLITDFVVVSEAEASNPISSCPVVDLSHDSPDLVPAKRSSPTEPNANESSNVKKKMLINIKKEKI